jgi:hypothetical protein
VEAFREDMLALEHTLQAPQDASNDGSLEALVNHRLAAVEKSRLRVTPSGKTVVARDQASKIVHRILSVTQCITAAVNPEPQAALAWAGVLILINVCLSRKPRLTPTKDKIQPIARSVCIAGR